jgi:Cd2+/Zn2+-exporting ATPase
MSPHDERTTRTVAVPANGHLPLPGDGEGCIEILADRLREWPGVIAIEADFRASTLSVRYRPALVTPDQLNAFADDVGLVFSQRVTSCEKRDTLEACPECALRFGKLPVEAAAQFRATATPGYVRLARVDAPEDGVEVVRPLSEKPWGAPMSPEEEEEHAEGRAMVALTAVCLAALLGGIALEKLALPDWTAHGLYVVSAVSGGWFAARSTFAALRRLKFDVNLLMILAAVGAGAIGYVFEAAVLMFLFSLSNTLEVYTMGRTRHALRALMELRPARALIRREGREIEVAAEDVRVGETVIVKPGEAFAVDGTVEKGTSLVDQSSLTGESIPVEKNTGDKVFAGTLNQLGALEILATRAAANSALARIVALVQEAQEQKSRTEEVAEWVGRYYTVAVMIGAGLMLFIPPLLLHEDWKVSLYRSMTLLVVASPCALVIATPATILSAIANAARNGILFKGGRFIEALGRIRVIAFDKTGTLTHGRFEVTDVVAIRGMTADQLLACAATAEKRSPHPLAQAVVRAAEAKHLVFAPAEQMVNHLGKGLVATVAGGTIEVGTAELFESLRVPAPAEALARVDAFAAEAKTAMIVRRGDAWGVIAAADQVRPTSADTVRVLRTLGITRLAVLSGDNEHTVEAIARRTGVDEQHGRLLPEDKVRVIAELEKAHGAVAMIGDGVNDAPALARATVGIAMGGIGSDAAMESADVVLMADDLTALPYAFRLAQHANRVVIQNLVVATGVMLALVTWVFAGQYLPMGPLKLPMAVSGHEGSTVVVILNGLRLLAGKRTKA